MGRASARLWNSGDRLEFLMATRKEYQQASHGKLGRMTYVVFGPVDCDCKPCRTKGVHILAIVGSKALAEELTDADKTLIWEALPFNQFQK